VGCCAPLVESRVGVWPGPLLETALLGEKTSFPVSCFRWHCGWVCSFHSGHWSSRVSDPSDHELCIVHGIQVEEREVESSSSRKSVCSHEGAISGMTLVGRLVVPPASIVAPSILPRVGCESVDPSLACEISMTSGLPAFLLTQQPFARRISIQTSTLQMKSGNKRRLILEHPLLSIR
jgi:hypothetical protein